MKIHIETDRLIMRDLVAEDAQGMFELDSDPEVHAYLGNQPINTLAQAQEQINFIRQQYIENGIGRWAVVEKHNGHFIGWSGFKLITEMTNEKTQYLDLGYRFMRKYWGKGLAIESAKASLEYGFEQLKQKEICAMADVSHKASNNILKNIGMKRLDECENHTKYFTFLIRFLGPWGAWRWFLFDHFSQWRLNWDAFINVSALSL